MTNFSPLINSVYTKRGSTEDWQHKQQALMKFVAKLDQHERVLVKGVWQDDYHYPAVLLYDDLHKQPRVYYVEHINKPLKMTVFIDKFFSDDKFQASCREILLSGNKTSTL